MADVELVIKIPEEDFEHIKLVAEMQKEEAGLLIMPHSYTLIANGVPLPKGHGRLIDADAFIKAECSQCDGYCDVCDCDCLNCKFEHRCEFIKDIDSADVIVEADKEGAEE